MSGWINHDDVVRQLLGFGLSPALPLELAKSGAKSRRCPAEGYGKTAGWYRLSEWISREGPMLVGTFGIFDGPNSNTQKVALTKSCTACGAEMSLKEKACPACGEKVFKRREMSDDELAAMKARHAADRKAADAERKEEIEKAATWARAVWRVAKECTPADHDYFARKGLTTPAGARIYPGNEGVKLAGSKDDDYRYLGQFAGALVVPMCDVDGQPYGVQFILSRERHKERIRRIERDKDSWPPGHSAEGKVFLVGGIPGELCLVAEGYATGVSLYMATGLPVAVAFSAGNLQAAIKALRKRYKRARFLICADDDWLQTCHACGHVTRVEGENCEHCGQPHHKINAGRTKAAAVCMAHDGVAYVLPEFQARPDDKKGPTDFNDLHRIDGINTVRAQIEAALEDLGWRVSASRPVAPEVISQGGAGELAPMAPLLYIEDAVARYWGTYGLGGKVLFDEAERRLIHKDDVLNLLPSHGWEQLKNHPDWRVARDTEIGFDPTEADPQIKCNLFGGWPTVPRSGICDKLLELLEYLCSNEKNERDVYHWILKWLAYPIQNRGAKMHSAIVVHGPQGTGKSRFFEAYAKIFGPYGRVLGQEAIEDKFNADWAEKKLFILADEVLARQDMYHIKNRLKGFITGGTIRVNPKNVAAHNEKNQMNIVFLSNERMPLVLENDDRRHLVIWVPPKLSEEFFAAVNDEIDNGGVEALHHYLLNLDLGDFKPWTRPPMTAAKQDLIGLGLSSEERFMADWRALELELPDGSPVPFGPCLGSHLYKVYEGWCEHAGERKRGMKDLISLANKQPGWRAGEAVPTWPTLNDRGMRKNRRMVIPAETAISDTIARAWTERQKDLQDKMTRDKYSSREEWLTASFFVFASVIGAE